MRAFTETYRPVTAHEWAIYVDIEGFADLFAAHGCMPMAQLTSIIHKLLASNVEAVQSIQAVQYGGDGFLIHQLSGVLSKKLDRPIAIATALMKAALCGGFTLRAQISTGNSPDIQGCYDQSLQDHIRAQKSSGYLTYGGGISGFSNMLLVPLSGSAILNAYRLHYPKGPLLVLDPLLKSEVEEQAVDVIDRVDALEVNWLKVEHPSVALCLQALGLDESRDFPAMLKAYVQGHSKNLPTDWKDNAGLLLKH